MALTKAELQRLAEQRLVESKKLLDDGFYALAYYLAGYVVELGLKACIANLFKAEGFPEKKFSDKCYTHDLEKLLELAGPQPQMAADRKTDVILGDNWTTTKQWHEGSRYEHRSEAEARDLYNAITDPTHGVFPWIKRLW